MPAKVLHSLENVLRQLEAAQEKARSLAIYVGMTAAEAKAYDQRGKRIYELYEELIYLWKRGYGEADPRASSSL